MMKLNKNKALVLTMPGIIFVIFNVIAFAIPFLRVGSFWVGYAFSIIAILLLAGVCLRAFDKDQSIKSRFLGWSLVNVAWVYFVIQLISGLIFMILPVIPVFITIIISVLILGVCLILLISAEIGISQIEHLDKVTAEKTFYLKSLQLDVDTMIQKSTDVTLNKQLKELSDAIRYGDPMSSSQLAEIENIIFEKTAELGGKINADTATASALCTELIQLVIKRNKQCKILK